MENQTNKKCKVCGGEIVERVDSEEKTAEELIPMSPSSKNFFVKLVKDFIVKNTE